MRQLAAVLILATGACSQRVYSPPSQLFAVTPIAALPESKQALDIDVSRHAQIFDPELDAGAGRLRRGIGNNTEVSVEGTAAALRDRGPSPESRTFYTGRVGVRTNPPDTGFTFFAGVGGGFADAGSFAAADAGVVIGIPNCTLVPTFQASAFISEPINVRPIDVTDDPDHPTFDTPTRTVGGVLRAGLRLSLSPSACRRGEQSPWVVAGLGVTRMMDHDSETAAPGVGIGIEIPLTD